jgi:GNAT superfamily N-acetyltransferase
MIMPGVDVRQVTGRRDLRAFVRFPWQVYRGDPNWVPPLIGEQVRYLDPSTGPFYGQAEAALYLARRGRATVGRVAAFVRHDVMATAQGTAAQGTAAQGRKGGFGFFEAVDEYPVAEALLDAACDWLRARGATSVRGPTNFGENESPGILIGGANCPPVMLEAHNPLYYAGLLERYGMEKDSDLYAWRATRKQIGEELGNVPPELARVAEVAKRVANVTIRTIRMEAWEQEVETARQLFNDTLNHLPDFVYMTEGEFGRMANPLRAFLDPDLALFAETDGQCVGFCVAVPDVNRVLIHLNGRLLPFGWLKIKRLIRQIDVVTFKLMGVLPEYRRRGIDALLYMEAIKAVYEKGYAWMDGSLSSELNPTINLIAGRLGAERYKQYRMYHMVL